jgi:hypothetical protein
MWFEIYMVGYSLCNIGGRNADREKLKLIEQNAFYSLASWKRFFISIGHGQAMDIPSMTFLKLKKEFLQ